MKEDLPPDWAIERVIKLVNRDGSSYNREGILQTINGTSLGVAFARYIAAHEEPPIDPDLLIAREACVSVDNSYLNKQGFMSGRFDRDPATRSALAAIKLARERGLLPNTNEGSER